MPQFRNPNDTEQPQIGVYTWTCEKGDKKKTIYVGSAGKRNTVLPKGTLFRGVLQAQKGMKISTNKGKSLDVDFVIGSTISIFEHNGWKCYWKHIDNDPQEEIENCKRSYPVLQDSKAKLLNKFRHKDGTNWDDNNKSDLAKKAKKLLEEDLGDEV